MQDDIHTLALRADTRAVAVALQWLEEISEQECWPSRMSFGMTLCLDEALTNVVSYAFDTADVTVEPTVRISCRIATNRVFVELRDNGRPYDPTAGDPPALAACLDEAQLGGHGVRLMRHYLNEIFYLRDAGWNCLTMVILTA
jgi:anti-sigma regulatory factor (Ser/Thr protein kinase)